MAEPCANCLRHAAGRCTAECHCSDPRKIPVCSRQGLPAADRNAYHLGHVYSSGRPTLCPGAARCIPDGDFGNAGYSVADSGRHFLRNPTERSGTECNNNGPGNLHLLPSSGSRSCARSPDADGRLYPGGSVEIYHETGFDLAQCDEGDASDHMALAGAYRLWHRIWRQ